MIWVGKKACIWWLPDSCFVRWKSLFLGLSLKPIGSVVAVVNVGGAVCRSGPGTLGRISPGRQATMAHFLPVPANDKIVTVNGFVQSRKKRIWQIINKFCITIKLSRWRAKNVTSLLPQPSWLAFVLILKLSRWNEFVMKNEICKGFQVPSKMQDLNRLHMSVSWCNSHYKFVLSAGLKARSATNNLPNCPF